MRWLTRWLVVVDALVDVLVGGGGRVGHVVETCIEISNNLYDEQSDFEYDLDTNSEISFIDDLNAVE